MNISFTFTNTGPSAALNVQVQFRIPKVTISDPHELPGFVEAPGVIGSITGGTAASTFSDGGSNWFLPVTLSVPTIPSGQSRTVSMTIGFRDGSGKVIGNLSGFGWGDAPFRRWSGNAFNLIATATAANAGCGTVSHNIPVAATTNANFIVGGSGTTQSEIGWWGSAPGGGAVYFRVYDLYQGGRSSIGRVTARMEIEKQTSSRLAGGFKATPVADGDNLTGSTKWTFQSTNANGTANPSDGSGRFYWQFTNKLAGWAPPTGNGGPSADLDGPNSNWAFQFYATAVNGSGGTGISGVRQIIFSAPHAGTIAMNSSGGLVTPS